MYLYNSITLLVSIITFLIAVYFYTILRLAHQSTVTAGLICTVGIIVICLIDIAYTLHYLWSPYDVNVLSPIRIASFTFRGGYALYYFLEIKNYVQKNFQIYQRKNSL